jgi:hypothetical protein
MTIELSNLTFTNQADIVPASGVEQIFNTGIANTLAGDDIITGTVDSDSIPTVLQIYDGFPDWWPGQRPGIYNDIGGVIETGGGNDIITGISQGREGIIPDYGDDSDGIINRGTIDTGNGKDIIIGIAQNPRGSAGIVGLEESHSIINTGDGDDTIIGTGPAMGIGNTYNNTLDTGRGDDIITGNGSIGLYNTSANFNTGDGNDTITGNCTEYGVGLYNGGFMDTGDGDDIITGAIDLTRINDGFYLIGIQNTDFGGIINTGNGDDTITSIGLFVNYGTIDTGNGDDIITSIGLLENYGTGIIDTGNGNDSIITEGGFSSSYGSLGSMFLGNGKDYLKGFGSGIFNGGNGKDTLELTSGSYTVGISGTAVNFTKDGIIMNTSEFEKLQAGNTIYNFSSLTNGQTISVA